MVFFEVVLSFVIGMFFGIFIIEKLRENEKAQKEYEERLKKFEEKLNEQEQKLNAELKKIKAEYGSMTRDGLKKILREKGLSQTGLKEDLSRRVYEHMHADLDL